MSLNHAGVGEGDSSLPQAEQIDDKPPRYNAGKIECIDAIQSALSPEEFRGFCKGNALKYHWREAHKGGDSDLKKAEWYSAKAREANQT